MLFLIDDICNIPFYSPKQTINRLNQAGYKKTNTRFESVSTKYDNVCWLEKSKKGCVINISGSYIFILVALEFWKTYWHSMTPDLNNYATLLSSYAPEAKTSSHVSFQRLNLILWSGVLYRFPGAVWHHIVQHLFIHEGVWCVLIVNIMVRDLTHHFGYFFFVISLA